MDGTFAGDFLMQTPRRYRRLDPQVGNSVCCDGGDGTINFPSISQNITYRARARVCMFRRLGANQINYIHMVHVV